MADYMKRIELFKKELDEISPTFCAAKWKQVTIHLESGLTHSCHHPRPHKIPLDELEKNVSALHNTEYKKEMRRRMMNGEVISECEYCNRVERSSCGEGTSGNYSDRVYKSYNPWGKNYIPEILNNLPDYDVMPSYLEVSFNSACNCCCIYCSPTASSRWENEINKFGPYDLTSSARGPKDSPPPKYNPNKSNVENPYTKAFWKWWPDLYENLDFFRITGGEPLLSEDTFRILDSIIKYPREKLSLGVNSNLCINKKIFGKFIEKYKRIAKNQKVVLYTSGEAYGMKADYIRQGMNYQEWMKNCRIYLEEVPEGRLTFMATYNILSISTFILFLKDVLKLKQDFKQRIRVDIPLLVTPRYLQADIITKDFLKYVKDAITFMYQHQDVPYWPPLAGVGFWMDEIAKLVRIYNLIEVKPENEECLQSRKEFVRFIDQRDERYNTKFLEVFPEYRDFYLECKEIS